MPSRIVRAIVCLTIILTLTAAMFAQGANARLEGAILDPNGAVLSGARLSLRNARTGLVSEATSNNEGIFRFTELPIGEYELTASLQGFQKLVQKNINLLTGQVLSLNLTMQVGRSRRRWRLRPRPRWCRLRVRRCRHR